MKEISYNRDAIQPLGTENPVLGGPFVGDALSPPLCLPKRLTPVTSENHTSPRASLVRPPASALAMRPHQERPAGPDDPNGQRTIWHELG